VAGRPRISCLGDFYESLPLSAKTQRQRWLYPKPFIFIRFHRWACVFHGNLVAVVLWRENYIIEVDEQKAV
jgi:hypothetical protein